MIKLIKIKREFIKYGLDQNELNMLDYNLRNINLFDILGLKQ